MKGKVIYGLWILLAVSIMTIILSVPANAANFGVEVNVCSQSWYCTNYTQTTCGSRTCFDVNACGTNAGKPAEYLACPTEDEDTQGQNRRGGSSGGRQTIQANASMAPRGHFTTDTDIIVMKLEQGIVSQKIIRINSSAPSEYNLTIMYPSEYEENAELVTSSAMSKYIDRAGDFNIIADARNILIGTYVVPVRISNGYTSKDIEVVIDVVPKLNPQIEVLLDSKIKYIGSDSLLTVNPKIRDIRLWAGENITYKIIDPKGNVIFSEDRSIVDPSRIEESISLSDMGEGYYTLALIVHSESGEYVASTTFTALSPQYAPYVERPGRNKMDLFIISAAVLIVIILILTHLFTKDRLDRHMSRRNSWGHRILMSRPFINITFNAREKLRDVKDKIHIPAPMISKMPKYEEKNDNEVMKKRNEILKRSYEKGFITLSEYSKAIYANRDPLEHEKEHIRREEEKQKRLQEQKEQEAARLEEEKRKTEERRKREEEKRIEAEKKAEERRKEEEKIAEQDRKAEERRRKEDEERKDAKRKEQEEKEKDRREKEKEDERIRQEDKKAEEKRKKEEERKLEAEKKMIKDLEAKEEKIIEKIVEKMDEEAKESVQKKEEDQKIRERILEKEKEAPKAELAQETSSKPKFSEILDRRSKDNEAFVLNNNELLYSMRDLLNVLPDMTEHVLHHHIKHGRNDFANWIADVFHYEDVAEEVRKADSRTELIRILEKYR